VDILHDGEEEQVVAEAPHALSAYYLEWVQVVVTKNFFLSDELGSSKALGKNKKSDTENLRPIGVLSTSGHHADNSDTGNANKNKEDCSPVVAVLLAAEETDTHEGSDNHNNSTHHLVDGGGGHGQGHKHK